MLLKLAVAHVPGFSGARAPADKVGRRPFLAALGLDVNNPIDASKIDDLEAEIMDAIDDMRIDPDVKTLGGKPLTALACAKRLCAAEPYLGCVTGESMFQFYTHLARYEKKRLLHSKALTQKLREALRRQERATAAQAARHPSLSERRWRLCLWRQRRRTRVQLDVVRRIL